MVDTTHSACYVKCIIPPQPIITALSRCSAGGSGRVYALRVTMPLMPDQKPTLEYAKPTGKRRSIWRSVLVAMSVLLLLLAPIAISYFVYLKPEFDRGIYP